MDAWTRAQTHKHTHAHIQANKSKHILYINAILGELMLWTRFEDESCRSQAWAECNTKLAAQSGDRPEYSDVANVSGFYKLECVFCEAT